MNKRFYPFFLSISFLHVLALFGWNLLRTHESTQARHGMRVRVSSETIEARVPVAPVTPKKQFTQSKTISTPVKTEQTTQEVVSTSAPQPTLSGAQAETLKDSYMSEIRSKIEANKSYPLISRRMGQTGIVVVGFTLLKDGSIIDLHVHKSSRFDRLDASAVDAVRKVGRFNPIPSELQETQMDITVPVKFYL